MKKLDIIIGIVTVIAAVYIGFTIGSHGRAIDRLMLENQRLYTADSLLLEAIKSTDSLQWRADSILMDGIMLLNKKIGEIGNENK